MPRVTKDPQIRIEELMDTAEKLFNTRGYQQTQISDIVKTVGVAQGTFYYYFKSKEEVLEAIVGRKISRLLEVVESFVANSDLNAPQKIEQVFIKTIQQLKTEEGLLFEFLFEDHNLHIVERLDRQARSRVASQYTKIIQEGIEQGYFKVSFPEGVVDYILAVNRCAIDSLYKKEPEEIEQQRFEIAQSMLEAALGAKPGSIKLRE